MASPKPKPEQLVPDQLVEQDLIDSYAAELDTLGPTDARVEYYSLAHATNERTRRKLFDALRAKYPLMAAEIRQELHTAS